MNVKQKPVALLTVVADNGMIGNVDDSPLPFDFDTGMAWMLHIESGSVSDSVSESGSTMDHGDGNTNSNENSNNGLKHSLVYGRRVYEEFAGYGMLPSGGGINCVVSASLANQDGSPRPLPTVLGDESTINDRLVAVGSVEQAIELGSQLEKSNPQDGDLCLVLGGQRVYTDSLPKATFLRKFHMRTSFEGGIMFPSHSEDEWTPIYKSKPKTEKNKVDGKDVELQVVEYVRVNEKDDKELAPVMEAIKKVNRVFGPMEELTDF